MVQSSKTLACLLCINMGVAISPAVIKISPRERQNRCVPQRVDLVWRDEHQRAQTGLMQAGQHNRAHGSKD
ncbi:MAG: hypothetical protein AB1Z29_22840 [Desulfobacterales bacterium]